MRRLASFVLASVAACSSPPPATPRDTLTYAPGHLLPLGRLSTDARLDSIMVAGASEELSLMNEPPLDPSRIDGNVFRLLYRPSFKSAVALRVTDAGSGCSLTRKVAVQREPREIGKEPGGIILLERQSDSLVQADSFPISAADCNALRSAVDSLHLETEPEFAMGLDGERHLFERIRQGRYLGREVWSPDSARSPQYANAARIFLRWAPPAPSQRR